MGSDIKDAAKETWGSVKDFFRGVGDGGKDVYENGIYPGIDWLNHNVNPTYDVFNAGYSHFTGKDFLHQTPVNKTETKVYGILAIIPGVKLAAKTSTSIWSFTSKLSSVKNAFGHWKKHASEFPEFLNAKQYVEGAKKFLNNSPAGTLMKTRANGDILKYHPGTNTFGVMDAKGVPRTMFRPTDGMKYWLGQ